MKPLLSTVNKGLRHPRVWSIAMVWMCCLAYVLFQGGKTSLMLLSMVTLLCVYLAIAGFSGVRRAQGVRRLSSGPDHEELLHAGDQVQVQLSLTIPGFLPLPYVVVREMLHRHNGESWSFKESLIPNMRGNGELSFQTPPLERGKYVFSETECASEDIFGLIEHRGKFKAKGEFRVLPRTVFIPYWQLYDRKSRLSGPQTALTRSRRETTQINGVRDYVYGDRLSRIHWNATAKTGNWKSKEFEHESVPKTILVLDALASSYEHGDAFEIAVSTAASLLEYGARERMGMGLLTLSDETSYMAPSESQLERQKMMHHLVDIQYNGQDTHLLPGVEKIARQLPQGAYFVVISPQKDEKILELLRWADTRGMTPCHILMDTSESRRSAEWNAMLRGRGTRSFTVSHLQELPTVMGGGSV
ncbi:DUF58 domain-containing protein [Paenibacillus sp. 1781tsa1]|uniref:DUF58 domain-containing protein n=1 Tax=unclassified Paenibacillus TaxID=185978 RepID=UPI00209CCA9D|nr:DUF58 domain-containing protein [Paenibacillus sp. 1781tsa1]MCP1185843.1 DUF58 domain-containing protein [Paenibacillus sp. 1781tsa1]